MWFNEFKCQSFRHMTGAKWWQKLTGELKKERKWQFLSTMHYCTSNGRFVGFVYISNSIILTIKINQMAHFWYPRSPNGEGVYCFTSVRLSIRPSVLPSVQDIFRHTFLSNYWWQESDIWSQASYRYPIS